MKTKNNNLQPTASFGEDVPTLLEQYREKGTLVRLHIVKGRGVKFNIPCRIINYERTSKNVTVYHVDEKSVYVFKVNEIDDVTT